MTSLSFHELFSAIYIFQAYFMSWIYFGGCDMKCCIQLEGGRKKPEVTYMWDKGRVFIEENLSSEILLPLKCFFWKKFCYIKHKKQKADHIFSFVTSESVVLIYFKTNPWAKKKTRNTCVWIGKYFKTFHYLNFFHIFLGFLEWTCVLS